MYMAFRNKLSIMICNFKHKIWDLWEPDKIIFFHNFIESWFLQTLLGNFTSITYGYLRSKLKYLYAQFTIQTFSEAHFYVYNKEPQ